MTYSFNDNMIDDQDSHLDGRWQGFIDIHCHLLPGLDDGPATVAETLALCQKLVEEGVGCVVATPHQLGRFDGYNEAAKVRQATSEMNGQLQTAGIKLTVLPGGDVRVDERICQLLRTDSILTLADGGRYILLELPHETFIDIELLIRELDTLNVKAIISHPERHYGLSKRPSTILKWLEIGAYLQVNTSSLLGYFGSEVRDVAWHFLQSGWVSLVATDSHNVNTRRPRMRAAFKSISARLGADVARLVCIENPSRVVKGEDLTAAWRNDLQEANL